MRSGTASTKSDSRRDASFRGNGVASLHVRSVSVLYVRSFSFMARNGSTKVT